MRVNGGIIGNSLVPNTIDRSNQSGLFTLDNSLRGYGGALGDSTLKLVGFAEFNNTSSFTLGSGSQLVNGLQPNDVIYWIMTDAYVGSTSTTTVANSLNTAYNWYAEAFREPFDGVSVNSITNRELAFYDIRRNSDSFRAIVNTDLNSTIMGAYRSYIVTGYGIVTQPGNYRIYTNTSNLPSGSSTYYKHTYAFVFRNVDINRLTTYRAPYGLSTPYTPYTRVLLGKSLQLSTSPFAGYYQSDDNFRSLTLPSGNDRDTLIGVVISTYDIVSDWPDSLNSKNRGYYDRKNLGGSGYFSMLTTDRFSNNGLTTHAFIGAASDMQLTTYVPGTASTYFPTNSNLYISAYSVMVPSL
jgi:hypothetical protein